MAKTDADFEAEMDIETLSRAEEIMNDRARLARAKSFAAQRADKMATIARNLPGSGPKRFDKTVSGSTMRPR